MSYDEIDNLQTDFAHLEREFVVTIQTPIGGIETMMTAIDQQIPLIQGKYSHCSYIRKSGCQRFQALEGSHAGDEQTIQTTDAAEIVFSIPCEPDLLKTVLKTIFSFHVNEEPTVRVHQAWGYRAKYVDDKDNPNRYWNRPDSAEIHGTSASTNISDDSRE